MYYYGDSTALHSTPLTTVDAPTTTRWMRRVGIIGGVPAAMALTLFWQEPEGTVAARHLSGTTRCERVCGYSGETARTLSNSPRLNALPGGATVIRRTSRKACATSDLPSSLPTMYGGKVGRAGRRALEPVLFDTSSSLPSSHRTRWTARRK